MYSTVDVVAYFGALLGELARVAFLVTSGGALVTLPNKGKVLQGANLLLIGFS